MPQLVLSTPHERQLDNTHTFEIEYNFRTRASESDDQAGSLASAEYCYWEPFPDSP